MERSAARLGLRTNLRNDRTELYSCADRGFVFLQTVRVSSNRMGKDRIQINRMYGAKDRCYQKPSTLYKKLHCYLQICSLETFCM